MNREQRIEQVLALLLEGNNRRKIAVALQMSEKEVSKWLADPALLSEARRALTDSILTMIPRTLERLDDLLDSESDTQAMNAVKVIIKQLENAEDYGLEHEELRKALEPVITTILDVQEQTEIAEAELKRKEGKEDGLGDTEEIKPNT